MAARIEPARVQAAHQSLHHFVAKADWSDDALLAAIRAHVLPVIEQRGPIRGWMIDDTAIPKKGAHLVGVARQYCGQVGKQDNCQVAVTLSIAADHASLPIAHRLYLRQPWADDPARRAQAGVPRRRRVPNQAADSARADTRRHRGGRAQGHRARRCGIRRRYRVPRRDHRAWPRLRRRHPDLNEPVAARHRALAAKAVERARAATVFDSPRCRACPRASQSTGHEPAKALLAPGDMARGQQHHPGRSLCRCPCPSRQPRLQPRDPAARGVASGGMAERRAGAHQNIGSPPCRPPRRAGLWSIRPSYAGASSATIRTSSRNSALATTKGEDGAAFTTTRRFASPPTDSSSQNAALFPPQTTSGRHPSKHLPYPTITDPAALPIRPERQARTSITTIRTTIARAIARTLPRCPCCQRQAIIQGL